MPSIDPYFINLARDHGRKKATSLAHRCRPTSAPTMFASTSRASLRTIIKQQRPTQRQRNFVSTVLLSKTYEDKTVTELRNELRKRGLAVCVQCL